MRQVSRTYGQGAAEVHALDHINLSVDAGGMVAVMGPSGSGKSTLLTIAGSLEDPTSGQVVVAGEELIKLSRNAKARQARSTPRTARRSCGSSTPRAAAASSRPAHPRLSGECEIQRTRHAPAIGTASL